MECGVSSSKLLGGQQRVCFLGRWCPSAVDFDYPRDKRGVVLFFIPFPVCVHVNRMCCLLLDNENG